jgi:hypothetical protein
LLWARCRRDPGRQSASWGGSARRVHRHRPPGGLRSTTIRAAPISASAKVTASSAVSNGPSPLSCQSGLLSTGLVEWIELGNCDPFHSLMRAPTASYNAAAGTAAPDLRSASHDPRPRQSA